MDFGSILAQWEEQEKKGKQKRPGQIAHDAKSHYEKTHDVKPRHKTGQRRAALIKKKPDAFIDLHGLTRDEAWTILEEFFDTSRKMGLEKVKIIHGKGNPPVNEAPLRILSRKFIENCSFAGESAYCNAKEGGSGATWVILKK